MTLIGSGSAGQVAYWVDDEELGGHDDHFWDTANNYLGVGTTSPHCPLHVVRSGTAIDAALGDVGVFQNNTTGSSAYVRINAHSTGHAALYFGHEEDGGMQSISCDNANDEMEITAGKVGIGVASPNEKLEVSGKIRTNSVFNVNNMDGITQVVTITDAAGTHRLTFTGGILTDYVVSP